jgi:hypothetical protein
VSSGSRRQPLRQRIGAYLSLGPREQQPIAPFEPGRLESGYYNELSHKALVHGSPDGALAALRETTRDRRVVHPVAITQLGLGAWQLSLSDPGWLRALRPIAEWLADDLDDQGRLVFLFRMPHTYELEPPWISSMAQGEAVSLFLRCASVLNDHSFVAAAAHAVAPLLDPDLGLIASTAEGPVLQEYPTDPPAHVLNGWLFSLWGLYDMAVAGRSEPRLSAAARTAFDDGVDALERRLPLYETAHSWSQYDLYPYKRSVTNIASPFYHRLHIAQLRATAQLRPDSGALTSTADRWEAALGSSLWRSEAFVRKVLFRLAVPRRPIG